jgi:hypothetical protein
MLSDDICNVWQAQGSGMAPLTLEELRKKGNEFHATIARRNFREYLVTALLVPYFGRCAWVTPLPLMRVGNVLMIGGLLYMAYQLHRRAAGSDSPADLGWNTCLAFHRGQLERQRDALASIWKWYLGPLVPGMAVLTMAGCIAGFRHSALAGMLSLVIVGFVALVLWWLGRVNRKAAAGIQRQIDALG